MSKVELYARIQNIETEIFHLSNSIFTLKNTDIARQPDNFQSLSMNAALRSERIACRMRNLVLATEATGKSEYMAQVQETQGIHLSFDNGIMRLQLPGLLPKRHVHSNTAFLLDPIHFAFQTYLYTNTLPVFQSCVICFTQIYDQSLDMKRIRDYDNIEFKQLLDTIGVFVLHDDSGTYCDIHYSTQFGDQDCTLVHIMEKQRFPDWLKEADEAQM